MGDADPPIAVLIIAAGREEHLERVLTGLERQTRPPDDVVVVELRPGRQHSPSQRHGARRVPCPVRSPGPLPLARGRNVAAASTTCDRLVFLDVDCLPDPDLVARYRDVLDAHPEAIACGPIRYLREGWANAPEGWRPTTAHLERWSDAHPARPQPDDGSVLIGGDHERFWSLSFGVTRPTWELLGGFDDGFVGYGGEDTDLGLRAGALGVPLAWFGGGVAYHQWHAPTRRDPARLDEMIANAHRFRRRWGRWPMADWFAELQRDGCLRFDPAADELHRLDLRR